MSPLTQGLNYRSACDAPANWWGSVAELTEAAVGFDGPWIAETDAGVDVTWPQKVNTPSISKTDLVTMEHLYDTYMGIKCKY